MYGTLDFTRDGLVGYVAVGLIGDGVVGYGAVDLYWGRSGRMCHSRLLLRTVW